MTWWQIAIFWFALQLPLGTITGRAIKRQRQAMKQRAIS